MAYQVTPVLKGLLDNGNRNNPGVNSDKMYTNITQKYRWGGLDKVKSPDDIYLDETVRRMVTTTRSSLLDLANQLYVEGISEIENDTIGDSNIGAEKIQKAREVLHLLEEKLPTTAMIYESYMGLQIAGLYLNLGEEDDIARATNILNDEIKRYAKHLNFILNMNDWQIKSYSESNNIVEYCFPTLLSLCSQAQMDVNKAMNDAGISIQDVLQMKERVLSANYAGISSRPDLLIEILVRYYLQLEYQPALVEKTIRDYCSPRYSDDVIESTLSNLFS